MRFSDANFGHEQYALAKTNAQKTKEKSYLEHATSHCNANCGATAKKRTNELVASCIALF